MYDIMIIIYVFDYCKDNRALIILATYVLPHVFYSIDLLTQQLQ